MEYTVWITKFGASAANVGIIGNAQKTRASWATGKLEYIPVHDGTQECYIFTARDDNEAFATLTKKYNEKHPDNRRPISGMSYIRTCRNSLRRRN